MPMPTPMPIDKPVERAELELDGAGVEVPDRAAIEAVEVAGVVDVV
jgi:hypothetical protein